jgi:hypothetical protein
MCSPSATETVLVSAWQSLHRLAPSFYATRRVSGGLLVPIALNAWWDFCILSADLGEGAAATTSLFTGAVILVVLFLLALAGYRLWQPRQASSTADATDGVA